ncbi:MAG: CDP-alcohol phosphatidyltransferase family protein [Anaerolineales bacterium]|nr:CDP-alcohol phosphatidyltransferase family protein [Anaerolineales bacterium]
MPDVHTQKRINQTLLGPFEKPLLQWFARQTPSQIGSDTMTLIGIVGTAVVFLGYGLSHLDPAFLWLASAGFVLNWFGDSMDGTLARYRKAERPKYGFFVDHLVDAGSQVVIFVGMGISPFVQLDYACLALAGYLLMSIYAYVTAFVTGEFRISYIKLGPTEMRLIAILLNTSVFLFGNPILPIPGSPTSAFDAFVLLIAALLISVFTATSIRKSLELRVQEMRELGWTSSKE